MYAQNRKPIGSSKKMPAVVYVRQDATVLSRWDGGFRRVGALEITTFFSYMQVRARFYSKNVYFYEAGIWIYGKKYYLCKEF